MGHRLKTGRALRAALAGLLAIILFFAPAIPDRPALWPLGEAAAALFGEFGIKDEEELGRKFEVLIRSRLPLIEDPEIKSYIQGIVDRLDRAIPPHPFPFTANVLLHYSMNAFAVPGGNVFATTGLILELNHEAELAGVLAHELAHVTQRHVALRIERGQFISVASLLGALAGLFLGGGQAGQALMAGSMAAGQASMLNYSRADETDADTMGMQYLVRAGYPPRGMGDAFRIIRSNQWAKGTEIPEYLSTHPDVGRRVAEAEARMRSLPPDLRDRRDHDETFRRIQILIAARHEDPARAVRRFDSAPPDDAIALMGKAILAARRNRMAEAAALFDRAVGAQPDNALIRREAGRFYYATGDKRAAPMLEKALQLDSRDIMAQFFYARTLDETGNKQGAHAYYEQVLRAVPEDSEVHYTYGRSLGEAGSRFAAYLHLTYSAIYENNAGKVRQWLKQARALAATTAEKERLTRLENVIRERNEYWQDKVNL
jgi:predicted Zn-dependent protease